MITGLQIRAARFALRLSAQELAKLSGVSLPTIQRFEQVDGVPPSRSSTLLNLMRTLEAAGIEFVGTADDSPGIRIRRDKTRPASRSNGSGDLANGATTGENDAA